MTPRLPDFVIVGEMKCGTTSLARHLADHPDVFLAEELPVRFFDERWDRGLDWYRSQFAAAPPGARCGDDTPNYLFDATAIDRLVSTLPEARLLVLLRDPVRRAWSHYWHHDRTAFDRRGFEAAVDHELRHGVGQPGTPEGSGYVARGHYDETVGRLVAAAGAERVRVLDFDRLRRDPRALVRDAYAFVGVDESVEPPGIDTVYNVGWGARVRWLNDVALRYRLPRRLPFGIGRRIVQANTRVVSEMAVDPALRARLEQHYAPHLQRLRALLTDLGWSAPPDWSIPPGSAQTSSPP